MASIDSIVIVLHDLQKHSSIRDFLYQEGKHSKTHYTKEVNDNQVLKKENFKTWLELVRYGDSSEEKIKIHTNWINLPSSHYMLAYKIDNINDKITFNFSVPKYLYGNNIAQFVTTNINPNFSFAHHTDRNTQKKLGFKRVKKFVKFFFRKEFFSHVVDYKDVEIDRFDLCYNQYFENENDSLQYLEMQKKITKKGSHQNSRGTTHYKYGLTIRSGSKSYKIYHKGKEYERGDVKGVSNKRKDLKHNSDLERKIKGLDNHYLVELREFEMLGGKNQKVYQAPSRIEYKKKRQQLKNKFIDVEFLQKESNKILRYEITIQGKWMSDFYMRKIYRKTCPSWKKLFLNFNFINSQTRGGTELLEKIEVTSKRSLLDIHKQTVEEELEHLMNQGIIPKKSKPTKEKRFKYIPKFDKNEMKFYKIFKKALDERKRFYIDVDRSVLSKAKYYNDTYGIGDKEALFSSELYGLCVKELHSFIDNYQIKEVPSDLTIEKKIDDFNENIKIKRKQTASINLSQKEIQKLDLQKLNKSLILSTVELLKSYSLDEIRAMSIFSKSAFYRMKSQLEKVGITKQTNMSDKVAFDSMILPSTDYYKYYEQLTNGKSTKKLPYFGGNYNVAFQW